MKPLAMKNKVHISGCCVIVILALLTLTGHSQDVRINSGAYVKTMGNASIIIKDADLINNGSFTAGEASSLTFKGSATQSVEGSAPCTFNHLYLDNSGGLIFGNSETVNGTLTFINGKITLGSNDLIMGPYAAFYGSNGSNYVITNGVGSLRQWVMNNATDVTYPVGLATEFLPLKLQLTVGSTADEIGARVMDGLYTAYDESDVPAGSLIGDHVVSKTWVLDETTAGGSNATVNLQWNQTGETTGFDRNLSDLATYSGGAWHYATPSQASGEGPYNQTLSGITSLGPIGVFTPVIRTSLSLSEFCAGDPADVSYTLTGGLWSTGNTFTAQLSDASGNFSSPVNIGSVASQNEGTLMASIPSSSTDGSGYRVRMVSSQPAVTGETNGNDLTINQLRAITGDITYYNALNTPLTSGVKVQLYQDGNQVGSDFNVTDGTYSFGNLCPGQYELRISSNRPTAGAVNTTDAALVNFWGAHPTQIEKVKFYAGDVTGSSFFINSTDAQLIKANFVYGTPFEKGLPWTFWVAGQTISYNSNPEASYPVVSLVPGSELTADVYGLCTGDFNRSFSGGGLKSSGNVALVNDGTIYAGGETDIEIPLRVSSSTGLGALSLILNFPSELAEIIDVTVDHSGKPVDWAVNGDELRIGWFTNNPSWLDENDALLTLTLRTRSSFTDGSKIAFSLADDQLNELADENNLPVDGAVIKAVEIESATYGIEDHNAIDIVISFTNFPNPFTETTYLNYNLPVQGRVEICITDILGNEVDCPVSENQQAGAHAIRWDSESLAPGIYIATLKLTSVRNSYIKTIKIIKENVQ